MDRSEVYVGIDICKACLDLGTCLDKEVQTYKNDVTGLNELVARLVQFRPVLVALEATGGLEAPVAGALWEAELPVVVVNPRQVRDFARAKGILAKTDQIDAWVLALFAEAIKPEPTAMPSEKAQELQALMGRRRQLVAMLVAERNRLTRAPSRLHKDIKAHIKYLEKRLGCLDDDLKKLLQSSPVWQEKADLLQSVPGVGHNTACSLLAGLPELGRLDHKKIAALVGVAPYNCDSGAWRGKRRIWGGRKDVRGALYMATLVATRYNPLIRDFYQRLCQAGKPKKLALTACMRKLLTILNAILKNRIAWQQNYALTS